MLTSTKSGKTLKDKGMTEFIFKLGEKAAKVFSMKSPLIFGFTDAPNVATGCVQTMTNDSVILADRSGTAAKVPPQLFCELANDDSLKITNNPDGTSTIKTSSGTITVDQNGNKTGGGDNPSATVEKGSKTMIVQLAPQQPLGFFFVDGEIVTGGTGDFVITGGFTGTANGALGTGVTIVDLGVKSIGDVNEAPATGYSSPAAPTFQEGHTYAFKLANGKYGLMEVKSVTWIEDWSTHPPIVQTTMRFDYKYQPGGQRQFLP